MTSRLTQPNDKFCVSCGYFQFSHVALTGRRHPHSGECLNFFYTMMACKVQETSDDLEPFFISQLILRPTSRTASLERLFGSVLAATMGEDVRKEGGDDCWCCSDRHGWSAEACHCGLCSMYSLGEKLQVGTVSVIISPFISTRDRAGRLDSR